MINLIDSILFGPTRQEPEVNAANSSSDKEHQSSQPPNASIEATNSQSSEFTDSACPDEVIDQHKATVEDSKPSADSSQQPQSVRSKKTSSKLLQDLAPLRESIHCLPTFVDDKTCTLLHDALKILFNQTLGWVDKDCEGVSYFVHRGILSGLTDCQLLW